MEFIAIQRSTHSKRRHGAADDCNCCRHDGDGNEVDDGDVHSCDETGYNAGAWPRQCQLDTELGSLNTSQETGWD